MCEQTREEDLGYSFTIHYSLFSRVNAELRCRDWGYFICCREVGWDFCGFYDFAGGGPLGSSFEDFVEAAAAHGLDIVS